MSLQTALTMAARVTAMTSAHQATAEVTWGRVCGQIDLPQAALDGAQMLSVAHYRQAETESFSGETVTDYIPPAWMAKRWSWFPFAAIAELGFEPVSANAGTIYATADVGPHEDEMHGPCFILCLFNDELRFRTGQVEHVTRIGQWYLIDDFVTHEVISSEKSTAYVVWSVPLNRIK